MNETIKGLGKQDMQGTYGEPMTNTKGLIPYNKNLIQAQINNIRSNMSIQSDILEDLQTVLNTLPQVLTDFQEKSFCNIATRILNYAHS
jgi:hypothetical protein